MIMCCNVFNVGPKTTLLPVWCRDAKKLDIPFLPLNFANFVVPKTTLKK